MRANGAFGRRIFRGQEILFDAADLLLARLRDKTEL